MKQLEDWQIEEIADTLRMCSNTLDAPKRESCLARQIMLCRNWIYDAMHDVPMEETSKNGVMYRMRVGQVPGDDNVRYENGQKLSKKKKCLHCGDCGYFMRYVTTDGQPDHDGDCASVGMNKECNDGKNPFNDNDMYLLQVDEKEEACGFYKKNRTKRVKKYIKEHPRFYVQQSSPHTGSDPL